MNWKDIVGYEGLYQISDTGIAKSCARLIITKKGWGKPVPEKIKNHYKSTTGYWFVDLYKNNVSNKHAVHRLLGIAFIPNPDNKPQINHKNGNRLDFSLPNLEWCTASENIKHCYAELGRKSAFLGRCGSLHSGSIKIICVETGIEYCSIKEAAKQLKIGKGMIGRVVSGKRTHTHGYTFKYAA